MSSATTEAPESEIALPAISSPTVQGAVPRPLHERLLAKRRIVVPDQPRREERATLWCTREWLADAIAEGGFAVPEALSTQDVLTMADALARDALAGGPAPLPTEDWLRHARGFVSDRGTLRPERVQVIEQVSTLVERQLGDVARSWLVRRTQATVESLQLDQVRQRIARRADSLAASLLQAVTATLTPYGREPADLGLTETVLATLAGRIAHWAATEAPRPALVASVAFVGTLGRAARRDLALPASGWRCMLEALDGWISHRVCRATLHPLSATLHALVGATDRLAWLHDDDADAGDDTSYLLAARAHVGLSTSAESLLALSPTASGALDDRDARLGRLYGMRALTTAELGRAWEATDAAEADTDLDDSWEARRVRSLLVASLSRWDLLHGVRYTADQVALRLASRHPAPGAAVLTAHIDAVRSRATSAAHERALDALSVSFVNDDTARALDASVDAIARDATQAVVRDDDASAHMPNLPALSAWSRAQIEGASRGMRSQCSSPTVLAPTWYGLQPPSVRRNLMCAALMCLRESLLTHLSRERADDVWAWMRHAARTDLGTERADALAVRPRGVAAQAHDRWARAFGAASPSSPLTMRLHLAVPRIDHVLRQEGYDAQARRIVTELWYDASERLTPSGDPSLVAGELVALSLARIGSLPARRVNTALRSVERRLGDLLDPADLLVATELCRALLDIVEQVTLATLLDEQIERPFHGAWLSRLTTELRQLPVGQAALRFSWRLVVRPHGVVSVSRQIAEWEDVAARAREHASIAEEHLLQAWTNQICGTLEGFARFAPAARLLDTHTLQFAEDAEAERHWRDTVAGLLAAAAVPERALVPRAELVSRVVLGSQLLADAASDAWPTMSRRLQNTLLPALDPAARRIFEGVLHQVAGTIARAGELERRHPRARATGAWAALFADAPRARRRWSIGRLSRAMARQRPTVADALVCQLTGWPNPLSHEALRTVMLSTRFARDISRGHTPGAPVLSVTAQHALRHILVTAATDAVAGPRTDQTRRWREHLADAGIPRAHQLDAVLALERVVAQCYGRRHPLVRTVQDVSRVLASDGLATQGS